MLPPRRTPTWCQGIAGYVKKPIHLCQKCFECGSIVREKEKWGAGGVCPYSLDTNQLNTSWVVRTEVLF